MKLLPFLFLISSCTTTNSYNSYPNFAFQDVQNFLSAAFEQDQAKNPKATMEVALTGDNITYLYTFGNPDPKVHYAVGSISKTITAILISTLVRDGKMSYGDKIGPVTVKDLLTHHAGITDFGANSRSLDGLTDFIRTGASPFNNLTDSDLSDALGTAHHDDYRYSSLGYAILQQYLEDKAPIAEQIQEVLETLGMKNTNLKTDSKALGYPGDGAFVLDRDTPIDPSLSEQIPLMAASGGYWSTLSDLTILIEAIRTNPKLADLRTVCADGHGFQVTTGMNVEHGITYKRGIAYGHSTYIGFVGEYSLVVIKNSIQFDDIIGNNLLLNLISN